MLETVRKAITNVQDVPFEVFFNAHLMAVQDSNIIQEIHFNVERNNCSILDIERLAQDQHERLVDNK